MDTIAAISTPNAAGGISMIRMSGPDSISLAEHVFFSFAKTNVSEMHGYTCAYGQIRDRDRVLDDVVLTVFRAPHSYTGEDTVEITCHGGIYLTKQILSLIFRNGARPAGPGEFTKRAFLNGKLSLSQAESVMNLIHADGETALRQATLAKNGLLGKKMEQISDEIVDLLSALAYWLDDAEEFPPELDHDTLMHQLSEIHDRLAKMSEQYQNGKMEREGIRTVLLGLPNAGKSSVMNWLCGTERSIVTDIAGTTRDIITEQVKINEFTLLLSDTAGLRETDHTIESIGISQAYRALDTADLVLYVIDASAGLTKDDKEILQQCRQKTLILWNKVDISAHPAPELTFPVLEISAIQGESFDRLAQAIRGLLGEAHSVGQPVILNERQKLLVDRAAREISDAMHILSNHGELDAIYVLLEGAANALQEINGVNVTDDVIDGVFSNFCVGK